MATQKDCQQSDSTDEIRDELSDLFESAKAKLIPEKSRAKYQTAYDNFLTWLQNKKITSMSEETLMAYFEDMSKCKAPSTLWSTYSMLKKVVRQNHNVDISEYSNLIDLLKVLAKGFQTKKAKVLTPEEIDKFLSKAPDEQYLAMKVSLIIGVQGACRREELCNITTEDIRDTGLFYEIKLPRTKTNIARNFVVEGKFYDIVKKYALLRPADAQTKRFFLNWQNGKCTKQVIGLNKFGSTPKKIAEYLKLPEPELYTGHCFRRTSATVLADSGADLTTLKRHGGWKSNQVAEGYIEDSVENKRKISKMISGSILKSSTITSSNVESLPVQQAKGFHGVNVGASTSNKENVDLSTTVAFPSTDIVHVTNCQVTINIFNNNQN